MTPLPASIVARIGRYLREPAWAIRHGASAGAILRLLAATGRHHFANWTKLRRDDGSNLTVVLNLPGLGAKNVTLRMVGGDVTILYEVFAEGAYDIDPHALPIDGVKTILDCGAHIGLSALYFAGRYPKARIIAIEPNPSNFALLERNTSSVPQIIPLQACISDAAGHAKIDIDGPSWGHKIGDKGVAVEAVTFKQMQERFRYPTIDLLKLDVEGFESRLLAHGLPEVRALAAELHDGYTLEKFRRDVAPLQVITRTGHDPVFALPR